MNMKSITIEQYLDNVKITFDQLLKEVGDNPINTDVLKSLFLEKRKDIGVEHNKFKDVLTGIELLFDNVPNGEYKTLFIKYFDIVSKLDGNGFESWLNDIAFNGQLEDDIKISYLCQLYDFELVQWFSNALENCPTNPKQKTMVYLLSYQTLVEGYFLKILNVIIYAMTFPTGILEMTYEDRNGNSQKIKVKNYGDVSKESLNNKLILLESSDHKKLREIAKVCDKDLRNAVAHHSYKLNKTEQKIEYKNGQVSFDDFITTALELADYRVILVECFHYYSLKCFLNQKDILTA